MAKVLSLFSGSLASRVATRLVEQHPDVSSIQLLYFRSPFSRECEELRLLVKDEWSRATFRTQSIKKEYQDLISLSEDGEFSPTQSCRSCQSLLLSKAARYMDRVGADYIVTGWIPGKRGLSPDEAVAVVASEGLEGRMLNPLLTANPLQLPKDLNAWTNGIGEMHDPEPINLQVNQWAEALGMSLADPLRSECRCKLTALGFGERVAALFKETGVTLNALCLLDFPMYFKAAPDLQIVLASDENEKRELQNYFLPQDLRLYPATPHGPMTLLRTDWETKGAAEKERIIEFVAKLTATYACVEDTTTVPVYYRLESEDERQLLNVEPYASFEELRQQMNLELIPLELPPQQVHPA